MNILPGTHHIRFLVDGIMQTSPDLPTTVDFGNNLVNYIEVNPDDVPLQRQSPPTAKTIAEASADGKVRKSASQSSKEAPKTPKGKAVLPKENYRHEIPQYLLDFDQAEESPAYQNAVAAIEKLPTPPSLPGFLAKPILNLSVLMKDDNSVLNMPNHTVLNHLATSSIKNNVLAVSATTRYRNKVSSPRHFLFFSPVRRTNMALLVCNDNHVQANVHDGLMRPIQPLAMSLVMRGNR